MIVKLGRMVACLALANLALAQPNSDKLPDPGTLPANGQLSLAMYPTFEGDVLVRPNCQVHLLAHPSLTVERTYACGLWFQPPQGRYNVWIEQGDTISPSVSVMTYAGEKNGLGRRVVIPLVEAGTVAIQPLTWPTGAEARFLSYTRSPVVFERRSSLRDALGGVALPIGNSIGGVFMPDGQALAISRPFEITRGQRTRKTLEKPDAGTDVFVVISRDVMDPEESLCLVSDSSTREADVIIRTGLRVYGVWYSQHGKRATLQFKSRYAVLPPTELRLTPASVVTFRANAQEVPGRNVGKD